ncbi:ADP-ribosyltransferase [Nocardia acidivorans]|uniref:ADP-ribosyltransferase n=1 Tax=Nocardia acidivorans TaxID=404580 RepID=UPI000B283928|nr:ADP-ribosyltransferase [Nocardia acidivorans]
MTDSPIARTLRAIADKIGTLFGESARGYEGHIDAVSGRMKRTVNELVETDRSGAPAISLSGADAASPKFTATDATHHLSNAVSPETAKLTSAEGRALYRYTEWDFVWINRRLREGGALSATEASRVGALRNALDKMPNFTGQVIRRADIEPAELEKYQPGRIVTEIGFTSTTKNPNAPFEGRDGRVEWQIESKTGKDVSSYSFRPPEEEVLFRDGTQFYVSKRFNDSSGRIVVRMVEVDQ